MAVFIVTSLSYLGSDGGTSVNCKVSDSMSMSSNPARLIFLLSSITSAQIFNFTKHPICESAVAFPWWSSQFEARSIACRMGIFVKTKHPHDTRLYLEGGGIFGFKKRDGNNCLKARVFLRKAVWFGGPVGSKALFVARHSFVPLTNVDKGGICHMPWSTWILDFYAHIGFAHFNIQLLRRET